VYHAYAICLLRALSQQHSVAPVALRESVFCWFWVCAGFILLGSKSWAQVGTKNVRRVLQLCRANTSGRTCRFDLFHGVSPSCTHRLATPYFAELLATYHAYRCQLPCFCLLLLRSCAYGCGTAHTDTGMVSNHSSNLCCMQWQSHLCS
jgi:hypothetical protein